MSQQTFPLILNQVIGGDEPVVADFDCGQSIADVIGPDASHSLEVSVGGHVVPRNRWASVKPRAGAPVHAVNYPQGGSGGSKILRTVAMVAVAYLSYGVATGWLGVTGGLAAAAGAGVSIIGPMHGQSLTANGGVE